MDKKFTIELTVDEEEMKGIINRCKSYREFLNDNSTPTEEEAIQDLFYITDYYDLRPKTVVKKGENNCRH